MLPQGSKDLLNVLKCLAQVSVNYDLETFEEASGHPDWDAAMNENIVH